MEEPFLDGLNRHGYAFQNRVIHEALTPEPGVRPFIPWGLLATEVPVPGSERPTRIDFILVRQGDPRLVQLVVAECKRVNPAYGTWCFARSSYVKPEWLAGQIAIESMIWERDGSSETRLTAGARRWPTERAFDISFELKLGRKGDAHPVSDDHDAIEIACSQVLRGLNGLVEALARDPEYKRFVERQPVIELIPAVFTTAELLTSTADLSMADLESGDLKSAGVVQPVDWLYKQYSQSPRIKHSLSRRGPQQDYFDELVATSYVRSVAIVSRGAVRNFLRLVGSDGW